ncbi:unnamed protein product, partial [Candidula unifasciata]
LCEVLIGSVGEFCDPALTDICYCDHINTTTGPVHFVVNHPARLNYSRGVIKAHWLRGDGTAVDSVNNITLPAIY